jgi:hypothetical protein
MPKNKTLSAKQTQDLLLVLKNRFEKNLHRHKGLAWQPIQEKLNQQPEKLVSLLAMEETGGEPDVLDFDKKTNQFLFCDFAKESPTGRRSYCYDKAALDARKLNKPANNALQVAAEMGITLLNENEYKELQQIEVVDTKTSSWLLTPESIRKLGGALFGDYRYGQVFIYHNGAESYYASRGFRGLLWV